MRLFNTLWCLFVLISVASSAGPLPLGGHPKDPDRDHRKCTAENAIQRKEWSSMSVDERKSYINAVYCLMEKPSRYSPGTVPASDSYYSDFAAGHGNLAYSSIHFSGIFLSWHRHFLYLIEEALHKECHYPSRLGLPYWNWPDYTDRPLAKSALFDGSESSLGSNGYPIPNRPPVVITEEGSLHLNGELAPGTIIPGGSGGGCIAHGPFSETTVVLDLFGPGPLPDNWTEPTSPQCRRRDLNDWIFRQYNHGARVGSLMAAPDIEHFQYRVQAPHGMGHRSAGGHMGNFFVSPLDPTFWLHHGQIDRLWATWQAEDEKDRRFQYNGTSTIYNPVGVTPEVSDDTVMTFVPVGEDTTVGEAADPMDGRYCYRYV